MIRAVVVWLRITGLEDVKSIHDQVLEFIFEYTAPKPCTDFFFYPQTSKNMYTNTIEINKRNLTATVLTQISQESTVPNMAL